MMKAYADLLARICLSGIFVYEAVDSIQFFQQTKEKMTMYGLTWQQDLLLLGSIVFLILGALLLLSGYRASFGALLLLIYWVPATFITHAFWSVAPELYNTEAVAFMHGMAIAGGLLMVYVNGSGRLSIRKLFATVKVRSMRG